MSIDSTILRMSPQKTAGETAEPLWTAASAKFLAAAAERGVRGGEGGANTPMLQRQQMFLGFPSGIGA